MRAFISYHHEERGTAGRISVLLSEIGVQSFMAHEHIEVSQEWREEILRQLHECDLFVALLSERYLQSIFCIQESGIAAFRNMAIIPLSLDNAVSPGFLRHIQSRRIDPQQVFTASIVAPGLARFDESRAIGMLTNYLSRAGGFRDAEARFAALVPYLGRATDDQIVRVLTVSNRNEQICNAADCARIYLPPLLQSHGHMLPPDIYRNLTATLARYAPSVE